MALVFTTHYAQDAVAVFRYYKKLAESAIEQVSDEEFFRVAGAESNSIAAIVKHVVGNLRSRWTDFLTSDGEKPWRERDREFEIGQEDSRPALMQAWNAAWEILFQALEPLADQDLTRVVTIRGELHSVMQAINRQIAHYAYHVGQIVFAAKQMRGGGWRTLSVPRGKSAEFNRRVQSGEASQR